MTKGVYRFYWDCGRNGDLNGIFSADKSDVEKVIGCRIDFGEVLGKHSEVYGTIDPEDIFLITEDPVAVNIFDLHGFESGYNPLNYISDEDDE